MNPVLPKSIGNMAVNTPFDASGSVAGKDEAKAAKEFESFFAGFVFDEAFKGVKMGGGFLEENSAMDTFQSLFVQEVSKEAAAAGQFGLARQLMRGKYPSSTAPEISVPKQLSSGFEMNGLTPSLEMPAEGRVTSAYGMRKNPFSQTNHHHDGMDIAMPIGSPVKAAEDGKVIHSGPKGGYGQTVVLEHASGYTSLYAHQSKTLIPEGEIVKKGQIIGLSGNTGRSTGPHLHFEVRKDDQPIDPQQLLGNKNNV